MRKMIREIKLFFKLLTFYFRHLPIIVNFECESIYVDTNRVVIIGKKETRILIRRNKLGGVR